MTEVSSSIECPKCKYAYRVALANWFWKNMPGGPVISSAREFEWECPSCHTKLKVEAEFNPSFIVTTEVSEQQLAEERAAKDKYFPGSRYYD